MSHTIKDTDYLFLSSMISARRSKMLTRDKMERMIDTPTADDAAKLLIECGYEDLSQKNAKEIEESLNAHRAKIFYEMASMLPEPEILDVFRIRFDYHNAKVLIKSLATNLDSDHLLSDSSRIAPIVLKEAFHSEKLESLPVTFGKAIAEAKSVLSRTENPQLSDFILDKAYFEELFALSENLSSGFLKGYVETLADSSNLRSLVRTMRVKKDGEFLKKALVSGGSFSESSLIAIANGSLGLEAILLSGNFAKVMPFAEAAVNGGSLTEFELACDNAITGFLLNSSNVNFGASVVISYFAAIENEITAARMILTGKLSKVAPEKLKERLRDTYA